VVFLEQGKASQALAYLDKALEFDPEHEQALLNSAILLQELGRAELRKVARERLLKLLRKVSYFIRNKHQLNHKMCKEATLLFHTCSFFVS
jgi:tetratricopeptide (TPR) repeat protein